MPTLRRKLIRATLVCLTTALWMPEPASAQDSVTIRLDHSTGLLHLSGNGRDRQFRPGEPIRIQSGRRVAVVVDRTNSALYTCTATQTVIAVPELDSLKTFTGKFGDYLPLLGMALGAGGVPAASRTPAQTTIVAVETAAGNLATALSNLELLSTGSTGMKATHQRVLQVLAGMRLTPDSVDTAATRELRVWLVNSNRCTDKECDYLNFAEEIHATLANIRTAHEGLDDALEVARGSRVALPDTLKSTVEELTEASKKALADAGTLASEAYALERLTARTIDATAVIPCDTIQVSWDAGRALTINVAPVAEPEAAAVATRPAAERKVDVHPDWLIRPSLGLTFLVVPGAEYPTKYTTAAVDAGHEIVEDDVADRRFTYGLTLGLTYRGLDGRRGSGLAVWLPDVTINPTSDVRAVAIGGGISYHMLKLSVGRAYTRHPVLNGQTLGQTLESADQLSTRDTFGAGRWYFGVSLMGLPPFVPGNN